MTEVEMPCNDQYKYVVVVVPFPNRILEPLPTNLKEKKQEAPLINGGFGNTEKSTIIRLVGTYF